MQRDRLIVIRGIQEKGIGLEVAGGVQPEEQGETET